MVGRLAHSFPSVTLASARSASRIESVMMDRAQGGAVSQPERLLEAGGPDLETGGRVLRRRGKEWDRNMGSRQRTGGT